MANKSTFMKLVYLILFYDSTVSNKAFIDKRANGKYRVKIIYPREKYTRTVRKRLEELPHVLRVRYSRPDPPRPAEHWITYYNGISITLDCRPSKAI